MKPNVKELHTQLLVLLKEIDYICEKAGIKYSLFAGTLIGAVRHQGFIPWDDDADIVFERNEFEKFSNIVPDQFEIVRSSWVPRFKRKDSDYYVDLFVFDYISNNPQKQKLHILQLKFIQGMLKKKPTLKKGGLLENILSIGTFMCGVPFSTKRKLEMYDMAAKKLSRTKTDYIFSSLDQFKYIKHVLSKNIVVEYKKIKFEDTSLMILSGYDNYLTAFYGNYMKMPAEHLRVPEHGNAN